MSKKRIDIVDAAFDFVDRADSFRSQSDITRAYARLARPLGFRWFVAGQIMGPGGNLLKFGLWDQTWFDHYFARSYFKDDAMVREAFATRRSFTWAEVESRGVTPAGAKILREAADFGHVEGFVTPVHGVNGELTTVIHMGRETEMSPKERAAMHLASVYFSEVGDQLARPKTGAADDVSPLTPRQAEALTWASRGMTREQIAQRMNIAEATVTQHIEDAKQRLERPTTMQAVVMAILTGQIRP